MKQIVIGTVAHVDAGKTTLSESLLYQTGEVRTMGRVDNGDAFLDPDLLEKKRGITIASHQANFKTDKLEVTLLDTPGHVDFANKTEQVLDVLDYAILVVSATDGVQSYTRTLWRLLERYQVPVFIFVNKMDAAGADKNKILAELKSVLSDVCVDFTEPLKDERYDEIAMQDDAVLDDYMETGVIQDEQVQNLIKQRRIMPVYFGSALKLNGIDELISGLERWTVASSQTKADFGARVFKISYDSQGERLTWIRVIGGTLNNKAVLFNDEKANQLRIYSGSKYDLSQQVSAGEVCAVTGIKTSFPGQGLGSEKNSQPLSTQPVLNYAVDLNGHDVKECLVALRELEDENPQLHVTWSSHLQEIHVQIMGEVQLEILQQILASRYHLDVEFGESSILYQETVSQDVEGVGHFEPLRHYAEVHLLLSPGPRGSGLTFASDCSVDVLPNNYQQQILTSLKAKEHLGVLTGLPLTDTKITLINGRASIKHSVGGDFREATWRAVRQGLMMLKQSGNVQLLEPWYQFRIEVDQTHVGRVMNDVQRMKGILDSPKTSDANNGLSILTGTAPVSEMNDYSQEINSFTHGQGQFECVFTGYQPCHNTETVLEQFDYEPVSDLDNTPDSLFCAHGAGYPVKWSDVPAAAHVEYTNLPN
ncbi:elongation factor G [Paucilactobacillus nenjiangensis]|uniref:TetM/TetW/TetO/TetS family tetracycline resistance ribosomal protection protein n=1 Tax=Paucilactobacillus nenjiangensis TaxID=1296540 RepID=A0A5P1X271_9LACO|nr:TetM/TetW/TetO/TetS family tetracycline resistance ribosomal protection protein [Paucilactobacillus nenjiangensis]QER66428.1 TetM/TetW/TetO/TetS family tetracycline resistance ribosomal protection protein [Paucilactobacillus nenjiangensis]